MKRIHAGCQIPRNGSICRRKYGKQYIIQNQCTSKNDSAANKGHQKFGCKIFFAAGSRDNLRNITGVSVITNTPAICKRS